MKSKIDELKVKVQDKTEERVKAAVEEMSKVK